MEECAGGSVTRKEQEEKTATVNDPPPKRQLRATVERQSRAGDPMSWQYNAAGAAIP